MRILLIPGYWLNAESWQPVTNALNAAGFRAEPLTRQGITLNEQIHFVVSQIDKGDTPVIIVAHSAGGPIAHGAVDRRPDSVRRVIYVDTWPGTDGCAVNSGLPQVDGMIALPDWSAFDDADVVDLTDDIKSHIRSASHAEPAALDQDTLELTNEARRSVPIDVIACEFAPEQLKKWADDGAPVLQELLAITDVTFHHLPTGHWPQFTKPHELAELIMTLVSRAQ